MQTKDTDGERGARSPRRTTPRAEHVGSLVRPPRLLQANQQAAARLGGGESDANVLMAKRATLDPELEDLQNELIREAVRKQAQAGLDVVTDGEYRRLFFTGSFDTAVTGFQPSTETISFVGPDGQTMEVPARPVVAERLAKAANPLAHEARFLAGLDEPEGRALKVTIPAASMFCWYGVFTPGITDRVYRDPDELADHVVELLREMVEEAIAAGATYVQFDYPFYPLFVNESHRAKWRQFGIDDDEAYLERLLRVDAAVVEGLPGHVRKALHLCRGNAGAFWMSSGALDPVAERLFALPYDSFLVEWDDKERDGDYSTLRYVPKGPIIGLGIVSTKRAEVESEDLVLREIEEASAHIDVQQLALTPQCGFGTVPGLETTTEDVQWRKLDLVGRVADRVWPGG
jgi:5-methyltetrahydropteroyltriglutamate--homocysteine methyltransferase